MGMTEAYMADPAPDKVNLGVGVYLDETGKIPLMMCVQAVEQDLAATRRPHGYLPMSGMAGYNTVVQELVFGPSSSAVITGRVATLQAVAGTGALRVGAGLLALASPDSKVLLSDPSWENHDLVFTRAGFTTGTYRYYDAATRSVDIEGMLDDLRAADPGTIVVMHASCHNPTGCDLTHDEWDRVTEVVQERELVPFIDMAYQGLSLSVIQDMYPMTALGEAGVNFLVANSFSKNFGLYGERVGAIHFATSDSAEATRVLSQAKIVVRSLYSNPPTQGAAIVSTILSSRELRGIWEKELGEMRDRIKKMRAVFRSGLENAGVTQDLSYITSQAGLFSYSGLTVPQMQRLRNEFHIYGLDSGRLCVAGLNAFNMDRVIEAVSEIMKSE